MELDFIYEIKLSNTPLVEVKYDHFTYGFNLT